MIFNPQEEKSAIDKLLSKETAQKIENIMKKDDFSYSDINNLLYLLTSEEIKLMNYNEHDRYVLGKFYTWIREFVKLVEEIYNLKDQLIKEKILDKETNETIEKIRKIAIHNVKFLINIFLFLSRSTLSINAKAFIEFLKQKFEYEYKNVMEHLPHFQEEKGGWLIKR